MSHTTNDYAQPIGLPLPDWTPRPRPARVTLDGAHCRLEPLDAGRHAAELYAAYAAAPDGRDWTYMPAGPFADAASYLEHARSAAGRRCFCQSVHTRLNVCVPLFRMFV